MKARCLLAVSLLAACARVPPTPVAPAAGPGSYVLQALPANDVQLDTRGRLRPQYRAAGMAGEPMPYDNAVDSSLILCAALGPLFGACAGVLLGGLAVAGAADVVVGELTTPGSADAEADEIRQTFAPNQDYASALGMRIASEAGAQLIAAGDRAVAFDTPRSEACSLNVGGLLPQQVTGIDVVRLEVDFEPGFQYRLVIVARLRGLDCRSGTPVGERRVAYLGTPQVLSRDPAAARQRFDAEIARAIAALGADVAADVAGRPRVVGRQF